MHLEVSEVSRMLQLSNEHALAPADVSDTLLEILCEGEAGGEEKKRMAGFIARPSQRPSGGNPFYESARKFWETMKRDSMCDKQRGRL